MLEPNGENDLNGSRFLIRNIGGYIQVAPHFSHSRGKLLTFTNEGKIRTLLIKGN